MRNTQLNTLHQYHNSTAHAYYPLVMPLAPEGGGIKRCFCLTSVCLMSVCLLHTSGLT